MARPIDLKDVPESRRVEAWRLAAAANFEVSGLPTVIQGVGHLYQLGPVSLTNSVHPRQVFSRTAERARKDGADNIVCSIELSPGVAAMVDGVTAPIGVKQATLWDLGLPSKKMSQAGNTICLSIERDVLGEVLPSLQGIHGLTLEGMGPLLVDHLLAITRAASNMPEQAAAGMGRATLALLAACVQPKSLIEQARPVVSDLLIRRAEAYIRTNIRRPELSPDEIAGALGVSRSSLYSLFTTRGGVATRIREIRLELAKRMLEHPAGSIRVSDVAYAVGFRSEAQFSRAFRAHFGAPTSHMRRAG